MLWTRTLNYCSDSVKFVESLPVQTNHVIISVRMLRVIVIFTVQGEVPSVPILNSLSLFVQFDQSISLHELILLCN